MTVHGRKPGYFGDGPDGNDPLRPEVTVKHEDVGIDYMTAAMWNAMTKVEQTAWTHSWRVRGHGSFVCLDCGFPTATGQAGCEACRPKEDEPKSQVRINAEADSTYCPWCLRCRGLVRMKKVESFFWRCECGAEHDERNILYEGKPVMEIVDDEPLIECPQCKGKVVEHTEQVLANSKKLDFRKCLSCGVTFSKSKQTLSGSLQRTPADYAKVNGISIEEARRLLKEREEAKLMNLADKFGID